MNLWPLAALVSAAIGARVALAREVPKARADGMRCAANAVDNWTWHKSFGDRLRALADDIEAGK